MAESMRSREGLGVVKKPPGLTVSTMALYTWSPSLLDLTITPSIARLRSGDGIRIHASLETSGHLYG